MPELPQLVLRFVPVPERAARLEVAGRVLELCRCALAVTGLGEGRPARRRESAASIGAPSSSAAAADASASSAARRGLAGMQLDCRRRPSAQAAAIGSCTVAAQASAARPRLASSGGPSASRQRVSTSR